MTNKELERLTDRFATDDITPGEQQRLLDAIPDAEPPEGFGARLGEMIDTLDRADRRRRRIRLWRTVAGIVASLAVVVSIGSYLITSPPAASAQPLDDTCATPEEAYAQTQRALLIFAQAIEKGEKEMVKADSVTVSTMNTVISNITGKRTD